MNPNSWCVYLYQRSALTDYLWLEKFNILCDTDRQRALRYSQPKARERFTLTRILLYHCLGYHLQIPPAAVTLSISEQGKPGLVDFPDVHFNVSHSEAMIAISVASNFSTGVDIEFCRPRTRLVKLINEYFSETEQRVLAEVELDRLPAAFYQYWTMKEAYTKMLGLGLGKPLSSFSVVPDRLDNLVQEHVSTYYAALDCNLFSARPSLDYQLAVCLQTSMAIEPQIYVMTSPPVNDQQPFFCLAHSR
jgi:phosphopantetheinyl transferase